MSAKSEPNSKADRAVIDVDYLLEFASQDEALAARFLQIFVEQSQIDLVNLAGSNDNETWRDAAHSLKSSASGIGAWALAEASENAMREESTLSEEVRKSHWQILTAEMLKVTDFINKYTNQD